MRSVATTLKLALLGLIVAAPALAQETTQTLSGVITGTRTLDASEVYLIDGEVYVDNGATLNIPAGTILKGRRSPSQGNGIASVLVVQRGGTLNAMGTAAAPIIFTSEIDDVDDPFDLGETTRGLWGGVIVLGNATNNRVTDSPRSIEGLTPDNPRVLFGAGPGFPLDDDDDSGTIRYVSIRHAGFTRNPNEEINGLTFGAVGRGTTVEYVEVFANSDDSFEFFGGTVNAKYLAGVFGGDDDFDWDQGYTGSLQFLFSLKNEVGDVGRCIEGDGAASPFTATPLSNPTVSNLTCIGSGLGSSPGGSDAGGPALKLRENTQGAIYNSIFVDYQSSAGGIDLEIQPTDDNDQPVGDATISTAQNFREGELVIKNNLFYDFSVGNTPAAIVRRDLPDIEAQVAADNVFQPGQLVGIGRDQNGRLDPRPSAGSPAVGAAEFDDFDRLDDDFFRAVDYLGAFAPVGTEEDGDDDDETPEDDSVWLKGWTALDSGFYLSRFSVPTEGGPLSAVSAITVGPNPAASGATVRFTLDRAQDVRVALYDVLGREVAVVADGPFGVGTTTARVATGGLPSGVYVLRLQAEGVTLSRQISVVR